MTGDDEVRYGRASRAGIALAASAALAVGPLLPGWVSLPMALVAGGTAWPFARRDRDLALLLAVVGLALATFRLPPSLWLWPAPVCVIAVEAWRARGFPRSELPWLRAGALGAPVLLGILATVLVSSAALVAWFRVVRPDVADLTAQIPAAPFALLLVGAGAWACANAVGEEAIFRGALTHALERALGPSIALVVQAAAFGIGHARGTPRGAIGVALATVYGLMLGAVRRRAGGLLGAWLAHVLADVTIAAILLSALR